MGNCRFIFIKLTSFKEPNCCFIHNIIEVDLLSAQLLPILMTLIFLLCLSTRKLLSKKISEKKISFLGNIISINFSKGYKISLKKKRYIFLEGNSDYLNMSNFPILLVDMDKNSKTNISPAFFMTLIL